MLREHPRPRSFKDFLNQLFDLFTLVVDVASTLLLDPHQDCNIECLDRRHEALAFKSIEVVTAL